MKMYLAAAVLVVFLVHETTQQPPGVPPKQQPGHHQHQGGQQQQQHQGGQQQQQHQGGQQQQPSHGHGHGGGHGHGQSLEFASEVHNADHILEHLEKVVATKSKEQMTEEELEFHYFKLHDYDNNNKLDGVEIGKALTHFHEDGNKTDADYLDDEGRDTRVKSDATLETTIDIVLGLYDTDKNGVIEYFEFKAVSKAQKEQQ